MSQRRIKFVFVGNIGEALEEAFRKDVVEEWKKLHVRERGPCRRGRGSVGEEEEDDDDDEWK